MANQNLLRALEDFRTNMEEFQGNMIDLRHEMRSMSARVKAFNRKTSEIDRGVTALGEKSRELATLMDRAAQQSA